MKTNIKDKVKEAGKKIKHFKVKLDHRTSITIKNLEALDLWKAKYPKAKIVGTIYS